MSGIVHVPVKAVVERSKDSFRSNFLLWCDIQFVPGQNIHEPLVDITTQDAVHLESNRMIVESEVRHSKQSVEFDKLNQLAHTAEVVVKGFYTDGQFVSDLRPGRRVCDGQ